MLAAGVRPLTDPQEHRAHDLAEYNHDRAHTGRLTQGRAPADIVYGARKMTTVR